MSKFPIVTFRDYSLNTVKKGMELPHVQEIVFGKLYHNFLESVSKNRKTLTLCKIKNAEELFELPKYQVVVTKKDFPKIKKTLQKYYEDLGDYNKCINLRDLEI
jgi:hypothetical protein